MTPAALVSSALGQLSDRDLLAHVRLAAQAERQATAHLIALLVELDARRLYLGEGFSSLFTYLYARAASVGGRRVQSH